MWLGIRYFNDWYLGNFMWNCLQVTAAGLHSWYIINGADYGFLPHGTKPLPATILTKIYIPSPGPTSHTFPGSHNTSGTIVVDRVVFVHFKALMFLLDSDVRNVKFYFTNCIFNKTGWSWLWCLWFLPLSHAFMINILVGVFFQNLNMISIDGSIRKNDGLVVCFVCRTKMILTTQELHINDKDTHLQLLNILLIKLQ